MVLKRVVLFLSLASLISAEHSPDNVPAHALSTCFAHTIDAGEINQCVTQKTVPNCDRLDVSEFGQQSLEACACNKTVGGGIDVAYVLDSAPHLDSNGAVAGGTTFDAEVWWESLITNLKALSMSILKDDSKVTVHSAFDLNSDGSRALTSGLVPVMDWVDDNDLQYQENACPNFDTNPPCESSSYTCDAVKKALADLNVGDGRRKVMVIFLINAAVDINDCLGADNPFQSRRDDFTVVFISGQFQTGSGANTVEWTGSDRTEMLQLAENIADTLVFNNGFFTEIRDDGEKLCGDTRWGQRVNDARINDLLCTIWPNPRKNEVFWVSDIEQNLFRQGLPLISDHLCLQQPPTAQPTVSPTKSPTKSPTVSPTKSPTLGPITSEPTISPLTFDCDFQETVDAKLMTVINDRYPGVDMMTGLNNLFDDFKQLTIDQPTEEIDENEMGILLEELMETWGRFAGAFIEQLDDNDDGVIDRDEFMGMKSLGGTCDPTPSPTQSPLTSLPTVSPLTFDCDFQEIVDGKLMAVINDRYPGVDMMTGLNNLFDDFKNLAPDALSEEIDENEMRLLLEELMETWGRFAGTFIGQLDDNDDGVINRDEFMGMKSLGGTCDPTPAPTQSPITSEPTVSPLTFDCDFQEIVDGKLMTVINDRYPGVDMMTGLNNLFDDFKQLTIDQPTEEIDENEMSLLLEELMETWGRFAGLFILQLDDNDDGVIDRDEFMGMKSLGGTCDPTPSPTQSPITSEPTNSPSALPQVSTWSPTPWQRRRNKKSSSSKGSSSHGHGKRRGGKRSSSNGVKRRRRGQRGGKKSSSDGKNRGMGQKNDKKSSSSSHGKGGKGDKSSSRGTGTGKGKGKGRGGNNKSSSRGGNRGRGGVVRKGGKNDKSSSHGAGTGKGRGGNNKSSSSHGGNRGKGGKNDKSSSHGTGKGKGGHNNNKSSSQGGNRGKGGAVRKGGNNKKSSSHGGNRGKGGNNKNKSSSGNGKGKGRGGNNNNKSSSGNGANRGGKRDGKRDGNVHKTIKKIVNRIKKHSSKRDGSKRGNRGDDNTQRGDQWKNHQ